MEGSDLPCYIVWPTRTAERSFWCIDAWKGDWVRLDKCGYMAPMGIEHFFDAFCLDPQRPWRTAACHALGIPSCHVSEDTHLETIHANKFSLTPRRIPVERKTAIKHFFSWMLHGSTKVVLRAVALLSANTRINRMSLSKVVYVSESNN